MDIDDAWDEFIHSTDNDFVSNEKEVEVVNVMPKCGDIYISTKTKIIYMKLYSNQEEVKEYMDINTLFWKIPVLDYYTQKNGIIKKQIKITTHTPEESDHINEMLKRETIYERDVLHDTQRGKKYKKVEKISCGLCKKDFLTVRTKRKSAFYNCFALVIRVQDKDTFKEMHVKVFNSGKIEIPGIQEDTILQSGLSILKSLISEITHYRVEYQMDTVETVLINSNFTCGFYINRDKLFKKLKMKYGLITMFDPCSYPGIQSKFYYNKNKETQDGICHCEHRCSKGGKGNGEGHCIEVSFMIFRTGSVLIVGRCEEYVLYKTYHFIKDILESEYTEINDGNISLEDVKVKTMKKTKKIQITVENNVESIYNGTSV